MTREEAIAVLQIIKPAPRRADGKSTTHTLETIALDMAIEALKKELSWEKFVKQWLDRDNKVRMVELDMAYECGKKHAYKWIPVSERLPEEDITVIGTTKIYDIYKAELYDDCGEKKWYADGNFDVPIVAWMPLKEIETYKENDDMDAMLEHLWNDVADEESEVES